VLAEQEAHRVYEGSAAHHAHRVATLGHPGEYDGAEGVAYEGGAVYEYI
jgi:hypothetical protein